MPSDNEQDPFDYAATISRLTGNSAQHVREADKFDERKTINSDSTSDTQPSQTRGTVAELKVGSLVGGRYLIIGKLGSGAMGAVYRVVDTQTEVEYAIKILSEELRHDIDAVKQLHRELAISQQLIHPQLLRVNYFETTSDHSFILMEYIAGENLEELRLKSGGNLKDGEVEKFLTGIAAPLDYLHDQGFVHLDLKPHNLIYAGGSLDGVLKIADFGISRSLKEQIGRMSSSFDLQGTLCYMAPEQLRKEVCDRRTDIYALGIILYHLLTGKFPFELDTSHPERVIQWHLNPIVALPDLDQPWQTVIEKCLTRDPGQRYANCQEILTDLERVRSQPPQYCIDFANAYEAMQKGDPDQAKPIFRKVITAAPESVEAHAAAGLCCFLEDRFEKAIDSFSAAIDLEAKAAWYYWRGCALERSNKPEQAFSDFRAALKLDEGYGLAWFRIGLHHMSQQHYQAAIEAFTRAVEIDEGKGWAFACRAECCLVLGRVEDALRDCHKAIELDRENPVFFDGRARVFESQTQYSKAVADWGKALEIQASPDRFVSRGRALLELHNPDEAMVDFHSSLRENPHDPMPWYYIGLAHEQKQMYETAIDDFRKSQSLGSIDEVPEAIERCQASMSSASQGLARGTRLTDLNLQSLISLVPKSMATKHQVVPINFDGETMTLATEEVNLAADFLEREMREDLQSFLNCKVRFVGYGGTEIWDALMHFYP